MRKFGFGNILNNQTNISSDQGTIEDNPVPKEQPKVKDNEKRYSAYRTIVSRHMQTTSRLHKDDTKGESTLETVFSTNQDQN